jgi:hypothetical protein
LRVANLRSADLAEALKKATTDRQVVSASSLVLASTAHISSIMQEKAAAVGEKIRQVRISSHRACETSLTRLVYPAGGRGSYSHQGYLYLPGSRRQGSHDVKEIEGRNKITSPSPTHTCRVHICLLPCCPACDVSLYLFHHPSVVAGVFHSNPHKSRRP